MVDFEKKKIVNFKDEILEKPKPQKWSHKILQAENQYSCMYVVSMQGSGKSSLVIKLIKKMCDKDRS